MMNPKRTLNVKNLGQVFTPPFIVSEMMKLIKNSGTILEPAAGEGAFSDNFNEGVAIEYDSSLCPKYALHMDFFDYPLSHQFDTIIGNPPYVRYQDITPDTKSKLDMSLFDERSNLYLFFIYKSILHLKEKGELIFIVPRDFLKATSSIKLNHFIYKNGTITDLIDLGDSSIFQNACPNCVIFRFEKGNFSRICNVIKKFHVINGQMIFTSNNYSVLFSKLFFVKVGAVSGDDKIFTNELGNMEFVCSKTQKTGSLRKMFYNTPAPELLPFKNRLIKRKIKKFNDKDWYKWGRDYYKSSLPRIYLNQKTRNRFPFFLNKCLAYDGSILAVFPKFACSENLLQELTDSLNAVCWDDLGFVCDGRFIFSQKSLENTLLPDSFSKYFPLVQNKDLFDTVE